MPDTKITALTALTAADPANDVLPIVDVSDTTMAASGTTKKISINNVLGCSGTATLASATITGDLTVDTNTLFVNSTNNRVGIGTASPVNTLTINGETTIPINNLVYWNSYYSGGFKSFAAGYAGYIGYATNGDLLVANTDSSAAGAASAQTFYNRFRITNAGVCTWENVGGVAGTAMTLNSTGLGVGVTPIERLTVAGTASVGGTGNIGVKFHSGNPVSGNLAWLLSNDSANSNILNLYYYNAGVFSGRAFVVNQSGNFLVRTPSTPPTIPDNEMMVFNLTSNTNLRISVKGTDGTTRTADITLA